LRTESTYETDAEEREEERSFVVGWAVSMKMVADECRRRVRGGRRRRKGGVCS
jgi:hypothetical protein